MRLTKISLTNFRSFKSTQVIDLAPVTLLFGPNSVGKSSVLMALAYVQQILAKGHCNPQKLDALGDKSIGGFKSLVHGQDLNNSIKIRLDFSTESTIFVSYPPDTDVLSMTNFINGSSSYVMMDDFGGNITQLGVEFEVSWSERHQYAFIKNYRVWVNDHYVGCIHASDDLKNTSIVEINAEHPLLIPLSNEYWFDTKYGPEDDRDEILESDYQTEFEEVLQMLNPNFNVNPSNADIENAGENFVNRIAPISLLCRYGAIPILGIPVWTNLSGQDLEEDPVEHFNFLVVRQVLSQAFVTPLDKVLRYLNESLMIGPLRIVPNHDYVSNPHPEQADWFDGSAAWDLLYKDPNTDNATQKLIKNTNEWFSDEAKLNTGYEVLNQSLAEGLDVANIQQGANAALLNKRQLSFKELSTGISLSANQLGTGISQVLPIVVAANVDRDCLVSIEQPELHIHPRFQVELGDLFIATTKKHSFLIETHSEHLILRLLKRIRQSSEQSAKEPSESVNPSLISIIYLEPSENGVISKRININEDGEFKDRWPDGFFGERREELM